MLAQMYEAVAICHDTSVFYHDIKPEIFIVDDGWTLNQGSTVFASAKSSSSLPTLQ
jgi:hypothetical protein